MYAHMRQTLFLTATILNVYGRLQGMRGPCRLWSNGESRIAGNALRTGPRDLGTNEVISLQNVVRRPMLDAWLSYR